MSSQTTVESGKGSISSIFYSRLRNFQGGLFFLGVFFPFSVWSRVSRSSKENNGAQFHQLKANGPSFLAFWGHLESFPCGRGQGGWSVSLDFKVADLSSETNKATDGTKKDLNIGNSRVKGGFDETGQIYETMLFGELQSREIKRSWAESGTHTRTHAHIHIRIHIHIHIYIFKEAQNNLVRYSVIAFEVDNVRLEVILRDVQCAILLCKCTLLIDDLPAFLLCRDSFSGFGFVQLGKLYDSCS